MNDRYYPGHGQTDPMGQAQMGPAMMGPAYQGLHPPGGFVAGGYMQTGYQVPAYPVNYQAPYYSQMQSSGPLAGLTNDRFFKGLLIGAAVAYILTNESVQRSAIKGAVKAWTMMQGGLEEVKERFQDAEAELHAAEAATDSTGT